MFPKFFSYFELFKGQPQFLVTKIEKMSTVTGQLMIIIIMALIVYFFISSNMVQKPNPNTIIQSGALNKRPHLYFNEQNFTLVFILTTVFFILKCIPFRKIRLIKGMVAIQLHYHWFCAQRMGWRMLQVSSEQLI